MSSRPVGGIRFVPRDADDDKWLDRVRFSGFPARGAGVALGASRGHAERQRENNQCEPSGSDQKQEHRTFGVVFVSVSSTRGLSLGHPGEIVQYEFSFLV